MRFVPTRIHGILDYLLGVALVIAPRLLGFAGDGAETTVAVMFGLAVIAAGLFTDYEFGLIRALPMPVHLAVDGSGGAFLALSPWIFGFAAVVYE